MSLRVAARIGIGGGVLGVGLLRYNPRLSPPAALDGRPRIYFRSKRLDPWH